MSATFEGAIGLGWLVCAATVFFLTLRYFGNVWWLHVLLFANVMLALTVVFHASDRIEKGRS